MKNYKNWKCVVNEQDFPEQMLYDWELIKFTGKLKNKNSRCTLPKHTRLFSPQKSYF